MATVPENDFRRMLQDSGATPEALESTLRGNGHDLGFDMNMFKGEPKKTTFMQNVLETTQKRIGTMGAESRGADFSESGELTFGEKALRVGGGAARVAGKVFEPIVKEAMGGIKTGLDILSAMTPDIIENTLINDLKGGKDVFMESDFGKKAMEAVTSGIDGYNDWKNRNPRAAQNFEDAIDVSLFLPAVKPAISAGKTAIGAVVKATAPVRGSTSLALKRSAEESVQKALYATTKHLKGKAEKLAPEILKRPFGETFSPTRKGLQVKAEMGVAKAGEEIEALGTLKGKSSIRPVLDALEKEKGEFIVDGVVLNKGAIESIEDLQRTLAQFGDDIDDEALRTVRRIYDTEIAKRKKDFRISGEEADATDFKKIAANRMRGILAEAHPDVARINKEYSFWSDLEEVISETNKRMVGQQGFITTLATIAGAGAGLAGTGGASAVAVKALTLRYLSQAFRSTGWRLIDARVKNALSNVLSKGNFRGALEILDNSPMKNLVPQELRPTIDAIKQGKSLSTPLTGENRLAGLKGGNDAVKQNTPQKLSLSNLEGKPLSNLENKSVQELLDLKGKTRSLTEEKSIIAELSKRGYLKEESILRIMEEKSGMSDDAIKKSIKAFKEIDEKGFADEIEAMERITNERLSSLPTAGKAASKADDLSSSKGENRMPELGGGEGVAGMPKFGEVMEVGSGINPSTSSYGKYSVDVKTYTGMGKDKVTTSQKFFFDKSEAQKFIDDFHSPQASSSISKAKASGRSFDEWVKGQGETLYHGTNQDFNVFSKGIKSQDIKAQMSKEGYWFTNSMDEAKQYADYSAKRSIPNQAAHETKVEELMKKIDNANKAKDYDLAEKLTLKMEDLEFGAMQASPSGQKIIEASVRLDNPMVVDAGKKGFDTMDTIREAKKAGHDGIIFNNMSDAPFDNTTPTTQYLVFSPDQVKTRSQLKAEWDKAKLPKSK